LKPAPDVTNRFLIVRWFHLALSIAFIAVIPAIVPTQRPPAAEPQANSAETPDVVFIGNSMLESRVDVALYEQINDGIDADALIDFGAYSSVWYLRLKNYVVNVNTNPDVVYMFFIDDQLTLPHLVTTGRVGEVIESLKSSEEPIFDQVIVKNQGIEQKLQAVFWDIYPIQERRSSAKTAIERVAASPLFPNLIYTTLRRTLSIVGVGTFDRESDRAALVEYNDFKQSLNELFTRQNFRSSEEVDTSPDFVPKFSEAIDDSFLPPMIDLVAGSDTKLVLIRNQRRPLADGSIPTRKGLTEYISDLESYLESHGVGFIDMNGTPEVDLESYLDGDHIIPRFKPNYTKLFSEKSAEYLK